ncbi:TetR/AcrR family transcriptional regulator [Niveispirillum fermenti]|uniref:TetR/AcrR family transcriptional regulator n=1 Tax=Niveispirillum fermenti TaxID=1233113 RepID=UPI003A8A126D
MKSPTSPRSTASRRQNGAAPPPREAEDGGPVDRRRNNSRAQIKRIASELFFRHGYEATSIRTIVDACGLTPAAFYNHFATKEALLREIVEEGHETVGRMMADALQAASDGAADRLRVIVAAYVRFHTHHQVFALVANAEYTSLPEPHLSVMRAERIRLRRIFEEVIEDGQRAGTFVLPAVGTESAAKIAAIAIGDMCLRVAEWYRSNGALSSGEVERAYAEYALRLVGAGVASA